MAVPSRNCRATAAKLATFSSDRPTGSEPLPALPYQVASFQRCRVNIDYHVDVDGHYYSVPHALGRQEVDVRLSGHTVEILFHGKRVASHVKSTRRGHHTSVADHMPAAHRAHMEWTPGRFLNWAASIGVAVTGIVRHLLTKPSPSRDGLSRLPGLAVAGREIRQRPTRKRPPPERS